MAEKKVKSVKVFAPAKINLTLHVTGQRDDGYHLIDSLVAFASVGDRVRIKKSDARKLKVIGPEDDGSLAGSDNLILKTADIFKTNQGASFKLKKNLPVASGIGGGSADAAAAFRGLVPLWMQDDNTALSDNLISETQALSQLGADIPMCLFNTPCRATGIGDRLEVFETFPELNAVLVNPRIAVSTAKVFEALQQKDNMPMPDVLPKPENASELADWLKDQRNDLEQPAKKIAPIISDVLKALEHTENCLIARMSGSGATCFALYANDADADNAARVIGKNHPDWWVQPCTLGNQYQAALPKIN